MKAKRSLGRNNRWALISKDLRQRRKVLDKKTRQLLKIETERARKLDQERRELMEEIGW